MQLTKLGPYKILRPVGKGGMGSVYEAIDVETNQRVAIKALSPQLALAEGFRDRFEAEIESLKTLRHEGIVRLYGYGEQDGVLFYSMELVEGTSLEDELRAGRRFDWREVTDIAIQLCLALKHAHDHGIVHRDIKPANILIASDERVKLADFGIARLFGNSQLTSSGGVLGTADYMAPEQADGRPVTARCDQYSLGGVMYALLAGRPPFRAKTLPEMLQFQRFAEPEPVRRYADQTPEQLERVILQLLSKDPADRFPNTMVLARHLQAMVKALSRPAADGHAETGGPADQRSKGWGSDDPIASAATQAEATGDEVPAIAMEADSPDDPSLASRSPHAGTLPADGSDSMCEAAEPSAAAAPSNVPPINAPSSISQGTTRFTTLEEEQARRRQLQKRSWTAVVAQLMGLVLMLAGLAGLALYLSRPSTADDLYATIVSQAKPDDTESIRRVQPEIEEFLQRFPDDARAVELQPFELQFRLDRTERRLQLQARRNGLTDPNLLPAEVLYLRAVNQAEQSPEESVAALESLVRLYGTATGEAVGEDTPAGRQAACAQLAQRQLDTLRKNLEQQRVRQLSSLRERLAAADAMSATDPQRAREIYAALVDLYQAHPWAGEVVAEARQRLDELAPMEPRPGDEGSRRQEED